MQGHSHAVPQSVGSSGHERSLWAALVLTGLFLVAEVIGGVITGSLALLSDAAHMVTDVAGLAIALLALRLGKRKPDRRRTFGYRRFEIIAAAFNAGATFVVAIYIMWEAYLRLKAPPAVQSLGMAVIAAAGLVVNVASMLMLEAGKSESLNVKGAYLEVWGDMLGSIGVLGAAAVIWATGWSWVDPAVAILIGLWVLPRAWMLLAESTNVLLEGVPADIDLAEVEHAILSLKGVAQVHDLHVWAITGGATNLSAHLVCATDEQQAVLVSAPAMLEREFGIRHVTLQLEAQSLAAYESIHG